MAGLNNVTVDSSYGSLMNLQNSTTGITNSFQALNDGYGNDLNIDLKQDYFWMRDQYRKTIYETSQSNASSVNSSGAFPAGSQNKIEVNAFHDSGNFVYTGITFVVSTQTTTSDTMDFGFYSGRMTKYGYYPDLMLVSGSTSDLTLGKKTIALSDFSFSASPGFNFFMYRINNSGVTPTVNFTIPFIGTANRTQLSQLSVGYVETLASTLGLQAIGNFSSSWVAANGGTFILSGGTFEQRYLSADTFFSYINKAALTVNSIGFGLLRKI